jgi:hypothetical protein
MMEYWNSGIMGSGVMQYWINGPATNGIDDEIKIASILLIRLRWTSVPTFHYSIFGANSKAKKYINYQ